MPNPCHVGPLDFGRCQRIPLVQGPSWCLGYFHCLPSQIKLNTVHISRADSRFSPSQWETALLCNDISHWLGANLESALHIYAENDVKHVQSNLVVQKNNLSTAPLINQPITNWIPTLNIQNTFLSCVIKRYKSSQNTFHRAHSACDLLGRLIVNRFVMSVLMSDSLFHNCWKHQGQIDGSRDCLKNTKELLNLTTLKFPHL